MKEQNRARIAQRGTRTWTGLFGSDRISQQPTAAKFGPGAAAVIPDPPEPAPGPALVRPGNVLVGLDEAGFKTAYEAFSRTRAELFGTAHAPELNSKIQRDIDRAAGEQ
ncbi:MAG TPA: hypothetical protein VIS99_07140 [Terrimicrobiaceae bacterium]